VESLNLLVEPELEEDTGSAALPNAADKKTPGGRAETVPEK
jgi:hypothetical protein